MADGYFFERMRELDRVRREDLAKQPSARAIATKLNKATGTIIKWLAGDGCPQRTDDVIKLVGMVRSVATTLGRLTPDLDEFLDEGKWREAHQSELRRRADVSGAGVRAAKARQALLADRPGKPISEYASDPFQLDVHRAIELEGSAPVPALLPLYVPRRHDEELAEATARALRGSSAIAVLVGDSSTGKTRACWEAVSGLGDEWRLWQPDGYDRGRALLDGITQVSPRTVIWLNDAQHYLAASGTGEKVVARLRHLLADASAAPVLILGTLWREDWATLTATPVNGAPDPHAHARVLLAGRTIEVPTEFIPLDPEGFRAAAVRDPRLAQAIAESPDSQITQYLAGVPALIERYKMGPRPAQVLIWAAMDARRLGIGDKLSLEFLADAALGYLTETEWQAVSGNWPEDTGWLKDAVAYLSAPAKGVLGPITRFKPRTRLLGGPVRYRLAPYLEQLGRAERVAELPPATFWEAAAIHTTPGESIALAQEAERRGLYRQAAQLRKYALRAGASDGGAQLLSAIARFDPDRVKDAAPWLAETVDTTDPYSVSRLCEELRRLGQGELVEPLVMRAVRDAPIHLPQVTGSLLWLLRRAEKPAAMRALLDRDPAAILPLSHLGNAVEAIKTFKDLDEQQFWTLAGRLARHIQAPDCWVLGTLHSLGAVNLAEEAAYRIVDHLDTAPMSAAVSLLAVLRDTDLRGPLDRVLRTDLARRVDLLDVVTVCRLMALLHAAGAEEQISVLVNRINEQAADATIGWMAKLHRAARGLHDDLVARLPAGFGGGEFDLADPATRAWFIRRLAAADQQDRTDLLDRAVAAMGRLSDPAALADLLVELRRLGHIDRIATVLESDPASRVMLENDAVARLLRVFVENGAGAQAADLASRIATDAVLADPHEVHRMLTTFTELGMNVPLERMLARDTVVLPSPLPGYAVKYSIPSLLRTLKALIQEDHLNRFVTRVVTGVDPTYRKVVRNTVRALRDIERTDLAAALLARAAKAGSFDVYLEFEPEAAETFRFGREADGKTPSPQWGWKDLD